MRDGTVISLTGRYRAVEQRIDFGNVKLRLSRFEGRGGSLLKMYSRGRALSPRGRHGGSIKAGRQRAKPTSARS